MWHVNTCVNLADKNPDPLMVLSGHADTVTDLCGLPLLHSFISTSLDGKVRRRALVAEALSVRVGSPPHTLEMSLLSLLSLLPTTWYSTATGAAVGRQDGRDAQGVQRPQERHHVHCVPGND